MIGRLFILIKKELRQHWSLVVAGPLLFTCVGVIMAEVARRDPSLPLPLARVTAPLQVLGPLLALALGHRMVVREYQGRAQLFLEALPLRRWEVVFAKYAVGLVLIGALMLGLVFWFARDLLTPHFALILTGRTLGYALWVWTLFFAMGFFGRLRFAAYCTLLVGIYVLRSTTAFELRRFGPFALLDQTFAFERTHLPYRALAECGVVSALLLGLGLSLALAREGSVAERLARRASPREILALGVMFVGALLVMTRVRPKPELSPFEFTSETVLRSGAGQAEVMYAWPDLEARAALVVDALSELAMGLERELGVKLAQPLRASHNATLEARDVRDRSASRGGVMLDLNLGVAELDLAPLRESAAHAAFAKLSRGRAMFEPNHWFLDGFSAWWTGAGDVELAELQWRRALVTASRHVVDAHVVAHWEPFMVEVGESQATALAFTLVEFLARQHGRDPLLALAREFLVRRSVTDVVTWLKRRDRTLIKGVEQLGGQPWPSVVGAWRSELARRAAEPEMARWLAQHAADQATVALASSPVGVDILYSIRGPAPALDRSCVVVTRPIDPYDGYVNALGAPRREVVWRAGEPSVNGRWRGRYQRGARFWVAVECTEPELRANLRLASVRLEAR